MTVRPRLLRGMPRWQSDAVLMFVTLSAGADVLGFLTKRSEFTLRGVLIVEASILAGVGILLTVGHLARDAILATDAKTAARSERISQ